MRALIVSDVHSNQAALQASLDDATNRGGFDAIWCLGDTVGYGPEPGPCLVLLRQYPLVIVAGNHDYAATGKMDVDEFNYAAATAALWTAQQLTPDEAEFLAQAPLVTFACPFTLVHGSLRSPLWEYLVDRDSALETLERLETPYCLVGHSHIPFICRENGGRPVFIDFTEDTAFYLQDERWIINPGSVGQPRDQDPRASYAIYNSEGMSIQHHRVSYDVEETQGKMQKAGLPHMLIDRLNYGL